MGISRTTLACGVVLMFAITVLCPAARGDSILFTTTVTAGDIWREHALTVGPVPGTIHDLALDDFCVGCSPGYQAVSETTSGFAGSLLPGGEIQVGSLTTQGEVVGYDLAKVKGTVSFSMTIAETQPLPSDASPAESIPFLLKPTLGAGCSTEAYGGTSSTCVSQAAVSMTDNTTGSTQTKTLTVSGNDNNTVSPTIEMDAYAGDRITINLIARTELGNEISCYVISYPNQPAPQLCALGAQGYGAVDPLFEFDQADFTGGYNLSDYYQFEFSPNIPDVPHIPTVPEPSSLLLVATSLLIFVLLLRRRLGRA